MKKRIVTVLFLILVSMLLFGCKQDKEGNGQQETTKEIQKSGDSGKDTKPSDETEVQTETPAVTSEPDVQKPDNEISDEKKNIRMDIRQADNRSFPVISLYSTVNDEDNAPLTDLKKEDIVLQEIDDRGELVNIEIDRLDKVLNRTPVKINLVLDVSGSMSDNGKLDSAKEAVKAFLKSVDYSNDKVSLISFDTDVHLIQDFTDRKAKLNKALNGLTAYGGTAIYDALLAGISCTYQEEGSGCVIAFTDGEEGDSEHSLEDVAALSKSTGIPVYIVGIGDGQNADELKKIAEKCNGTYTSADASNMRKVLERIYIGIYREAKEYYRIEYKTPHNDASVTSRTVQLSMSQDSPYSGKAECLYVPKVDEKKLIDKSTITVSPTPIPTPLPTPAPTQAPKIERVKVSDVEGEVLKIRKIYNDIENKRSNKSYTVNEVNKGIKEYIEPSTGEIICIIMDKGTDGIDYKGYYYFNDGELMFVYLEGADAHRLYFKDGFLFRWRYTANSKKVDKATNYDNDNSEEYLMWEDTVTREANKFVNILIPSEGVETGNSERTEYIAKESDINEVNKYYEEVLTSIETGNSAGLIKLAKDMGEEEDAGDNGYPVRYGYVDEYSLVDLNGDGIKELIIVGCYNQDDFVYICYFNGKNFIWTVLNGEICRISRDGYLEICNCKRDISSNTDEYTIYTINKKGKFEATYKKCFVFKMDEYYVQEDSPYETRYIVIKSGKEAEVTADSYENDVKAFGLYELNYNSYIDLNKDFIKDIDAGQIVVIIENKNIEKVTKYYKKILNMDRDELIMDVLPLPGSVYSFQLSDINNDGIKELIIPVMTGGHGGYNTDVCYYSNGSFNWTVFNGYQAEYYENGIIISKDENKGGFVNEKNYTYDEYIFRYDINSIGTPVELYRMEYEEGNYNDKGEFVENGYRGKTEYYKVVSGKEISTTEEEYNKALKEYTSSKRIDVKGYELEKSEIKKIDVGSKIETINFEDYYKVKALAAEMDSFEWELGGYFRDLDDSVYTSTNVDLNKETMIKAIVSPMYNGHGLTLVRSGEEYGESYDWFQVDIAQLKYKGLELFGKTIDVKDVPKIDTFTGEIIIDSKYGLVEKSYSERESEASLEINSVVVEKKREKFIVTKNISYGHWHDVENGTAPRYRIVYTVEPSSLSNYGYIITGMTVKK